MKIMEHIGDSEMLFLPQLFKNVPGWNEIETLFDKALELDRVFWQSFGTMSIDKSELIDVCYDNMIKHILESHGGNLASALTIVHFENSENNIIKEDVSSIYNKFTSNNPQKKPADFSPLMMSPTIHSDPVDGVYVQCTGSTLWSGYYGETIKTYTLLPGDAIYIPKDVVHSVKTLEPRVGVSFGLV